MYKYLLGFTIFCISLVSFSFASFQDETDKCNGSGTSQNIMTCQQKVHEKHLVTKKQACNMLDWSYSLPFEVRWSQWSSKSLGRRKENNKLFYTLIVWSGNNFDPFMKSTDRSYLYMYDCKTKKPKQLFKTLYGLYILQLSDNIVIFNTINEDMIKYYSYDRKKRKIVFSINSSIKWWKEFISDVTWEYKKRWQQNPDYKDSNFEQYNDTNEWAIIWEEQGSKFIKIESIDKNLNWTIIYTPNLWRQQSKRYTINLLTKTITLAK